MFSTLRKHHSKILMYLRVIIVARKIEKVKKNKPGYSGFLQPIVIVLMVILLLTFIILH
jgi:hypothetical protein